jgi:hypothetical protein
MQDIQLATDIVIGILGESTSTLSQEIYDVKADHNSVARCIRGTPSDATTHFEKGSPRGDPSAHSGRAQAVRCVDYTRGRFGWISLFTRCAV